MKRASALITLLVLLVIFPVLTLAAPVGKFTGVAGDVEVTAPGRETVKANPGDKLQDDAVIRTKSQGRCEVTFPGGSILRVEENSRLRVSASNRGNDEAPRRIFVELTGGKIQNIVTRTARAISVGRIFSAYSEELRNIVKTAAGADSNLRYEVRTHTAVFRSRGTNFMAYSQAEGSGAVVAEGSVEAFSVHRPEQMRRIGAGQATVVTDPKAPPVVRVATALETQQHWKATVATEISPERATIAGMPPVPAAALLRADSLVRLREESKQPLSTVATPLPPARPNVLPTATDTRPPVITLSGLPDSLTNISSAAIGVTASEPAALAFTLDGATVAAPNLTNLTEGNHAFAVTATDPAGNSSTQTHTWITDYTPPDIAITPRASPRTDDAADLTVALTANKAAVFTADLDGEEAFTGSNLNLTSLSAGDHTLTVEATDAAKNTSTRTLTFTLENYSISGSLAGAVRGTVAANVAGIAGQGWGGWSGDLAGDVALFPGENWQAWAGGLVTAANDGYWLADVGGSAWTDGEVKGTVNYRSLTTSALGSFDGPLSGAYQLNTNTARYDWQAAANGLYAEVPLLFSGVFDAGYHQYENNFINYNSSIFGYLGTTVSPFATATSFGGPDVPVELYMMGEAWPEGKTAWWGSLYEANAVSGDILPDGFIAGRTTAGGADGREELTGFLASLYIDQAGNAGLIEGSFDGRHYPLENGSGMFEATSGTIRATKKAEGYVAYDPVVNLGWNYLDGAFAGSFPDGNDQPAGAVIACGSIAYISAGWTGSYTTWLQKSAGDPAPWGIFAIELGGQHLGAPTNNWTMQLGGSSWRTWDGSESWLAEVYGTQWSVGQISGNLQGNYLTPRVLGTMTGTVLGGYDPAILDPGVWTAVTIGTFEEQPLAFVSDLAGGDGAFSALLGGTESLWTNTDAPVLMLGAGNGVSGLWSMPVWSDNFEDGSVTTYDGGAYRGFGSLMADNEQVVDAGLVALYVDPTEQTGYLKGNLLGTDYPDLGLFSAHSSLARTGMGQAPAGITAANFSVTESVPQSLTMAGPPAAIGFLSESRNEAWIDGVTSWGIWQGLLEGSGALVAPATWIWETAEGRSATYWTNYGDVTWVTEASKITGTVAGTAADWVNAATYVSGGDIKGLFDPATASWKAISQGAWLETGKFLELAAGNPAALQAMNIPAIQVGSATLAQEAGTINNLSNVTMDNVRFFATSTGSVPKIWATHAVSGNYSATPAVGGAVVPLSSGVGPNNITANFGITNWANGIWGARITDGQTNGAATVGGFGIGFQGGAAGRIDNGSFTGTGAGIVK